MATWVVIGAGPSGLCTVRRFKEQDIDVIGLESHSDVGGLWDIDSDTSTMYESAHLISSKTMTQFSDFPMRDDAAVYPKHDELRQYFKDYSEAFELYDKYIFGANVTNVEPQGDGWLVSYEKNGETVTIEAAGVVLANGTLHHPNRPTFKGEFSGEQLHSSSYRDAAIFENKRVLIVGCGNSGCDIAVDAVHRAKSVDMVVRRGYYFLPKFVMGKPIDTLGGKFRLPNRLKQLIDGTLVRLISGKPSHFGLPEPDYKMYESHPVINSMFLHHIGHGDIKVRSAIDHFSDRTVVFNNGESQEYDLVLEATGYHLHYPFIEKSHLNWDGFAPELYLNIFTPEHDNLFVMGMVEAAGLGWQGRDDQARLVAQFVKAKQENTGQAQAFFERIRSKQWRRVTGGMNYLDVERMSFYVNKADYLDALTKARKSLGAVA